MFEVDQLGQPVVVEDLDADWLLALLEDKEASARAAERGKLRLAAQWCVLHPATADTGVAFWSHAGLPGMRQHDETLGGEGTPLVAAFTPEPFAAALGISTFAGMQLLADAMDLQHRLPGIWRKVDQLDVAPWKARKVAQATRLLSKRAAAYVDSELTTRISTCGAVMIERVVAAAIAKFHPELLAEREKKGKAGWHVSLHQPSPGDFAGTSYLDVAGDTLDLDKFYALVCDQAAAMAAAGDTDPLEVRKAKALGVIADQQAQADLMSLLQDQTQDPGGQPSPATAGRSSRPATRTALYLHGSITDFLGLVGSSVEPVEAPLGEVEKLGPATLEKIREWLGHSNVSIRPVIDLNHCDAVDAHDPPPRVREQVILRDRHCVFPWCSRDARSCDLDHIEPYVEDGPPGQTNPENLAPLCRRHHRCKTSGRWRYRRQPDGSYLWLAPHGRAYVVTPRGTITLNEN
ncbi:MAG TPA: HNH endonuclease signature motif containing protein [Nocardioides sp.]|nr:HNH endonuclease signature motif containing protein [Nocardioides sp.]